MVMKSRTPAQKIVERASDAQLLYTSVHLLSQFQRLAADETCPDTGATGSL